MQRQAPVPAPADELRITGVQAALALWSRRPQDVGRAWVRPDRVEQMGPLLHDLASRRLPYRVVEEAELSRVAGSAHHEGVVLGARPLAPWTAAELMERLPLGPCLLLLLDGVSNPHNLGALLRTAAHYGALAVLGREGELPGASPAVHRVSEGGAEWVGLCPLTRLDRELDRLLKVGFGLVGAQPGAAEAMHRAELPARMILALGAEGPGLSPALLGRCRALGLPGTGAVQSLNVGVAGALGMGLWWARHGAA